jgi:hypothetical protein
MTVRVSISVVGACLSWDLSCADMAVALVAWELCVQWSQRGRVKSLWCTVARLFSSVSLPRVLGDCRMSRKYCTDLASAAVASHWLVSAVA